MKKQPLEYSKCKHPAQAKAIGRKIKPWDDEKWDICKEEIMFNGLVLKQINMPTLKHCF